MNLLIDNIKKQLKIRGWYQIDLANKIGLTPSAVSKLLKGSTDFTQKNIIKIAEAFHMDPGALISTNLKQITDYMPTMPIPIYGRIIAGYPNGFEDDKIGELPVPKKYIDRYGKNELLALQVMGDSMNKKVPDGNVALIHRTSEFENGDIMAVIINGELATLKHLYRYNNILRFEPESYDPLQHPFEYTKRQIENNDPRILIIGKYLYSTSPEMVE